MARWRSVNDDQTSPTQIDVLCHQNFNKFITQRKDKLVGSHLTAQLLSSVKWGGDQFSSWAGFIDKFSSNQNMHAHWLLALRTERGKKKPRRVSAAIFEHDFITSHELQVQHCAAQLWNISDWIAKRLNSLWHFGHNTELSIRPVLMCRATGSSLTRQHLTFKDLNGMF